MFGEGWPWLVCMRYGPLSTYISPAKTPLKKDSLLRVLSPFFPITPDQGESIERSRLALRDGDDTTFAQSGRL